MMRAPLAGMGMILLIGTAAAQQPAAGALAMTTDTACASPPLPARTTAVDIPPRGPASTPEAPASPAACDAVPSRDVASEGSSFAERFRGWASAWSARSGVGDHGAGFFPSVGTIVAGSGLAAGGGYRNYHLAGSAFGFDASGLVSYRLYQLYRARVGFLDRRSDTLALAAPDGNLPSLFDEATGTARGISAYGEATYRRYPRRPFYGIGPEASGDDRTNIALSGASYDFVVQGQINRHVAVSARAGLYQPTVSAGEGDGAASLEARFDELRGSDLGRQPDFLSVGVGATFDARDSVDRPAAGSFVGLALWRYASRGGAFDFSRFALDGRHYSTPFTSRGVLALRLLVSSSVPSAGARVPFYLQYTLGGNEVLRGFGAYRFGDNSLAYLTAEYRWRASRFLDIVPFVETGNVGPSLRRVAVGRLEESAGVGARVTRGPRTFLRVDWARSREGNRVAVGTGLLF